jgi:hypothetical protein
VPCHEADIGLYFFIYFIFILFLCRKPSPFAGMEMLKKKNNPANGKTAMPETKMCEGKERHARHDAKDEKKTLVWAFYFYCVRGLKLSRSDSA